MARHLYIGNNVAVARTSSGILDAGAIEVQKLSASGPTAMVPGDTVADSAQFRIVQGDGTRDIVSPWMYGKDVINWSGQGYVAGVAHRTDSTLTTSTAVAGTVTTKIYRIDTDEFETFSFDTDYTTAVQTPTQIQVLVLAAWDAIAEADKPDWLNDTAAVNAGDFRVTASKRGDTTNSGAEWKEKNPVIEMIQTHSVDTAQTHSNAIGVNMLPGYGDGYQIKDLEDSLMGAQYGYYNRVQLPVTPSTTAVVGDTYDVYNIVATKDGSSHSQIHGVDNLIEITVAWDDGTAAIQTAFEGLLNPYFASAGLAPVSL